MKTIDKHLKGLGQASHPSYSDTQPYSGAVTYAIHYHMILFHCNTTLRITNPAAATTTTTTSTTITTKFTTTPLQGLPRIPFHSNST